MGNKNRHPVALSPEEAERVAAVERQQRQSKGNFESMYGPTTPASFSVEQDMAMMQSNLQGMPEIPQEPLQPPPQQTQPQTRAKQEEAQEAVQEPSEDKLKLTGDPKKDCAIVSEQIGKLVPNPPSPEQLYQWKMMHGDIFLLPIDGKVYIYRYLKRQEWVQMNADPAMQAMTDLQIEDKIFAKCVLWPSLDPTRLAFLPANTIGMIVQQIRIQSMFLDPGYVATLTIKI